MELTRRAIVVLAGVVGFSCTATADDVDLSYGVVPYGEAGYGGSSSDCFIATAAVGTSDHAEVAALRRFRDDWLEQTAPGRLVIQAYYRWSPPVARWISRRRWRRVLVRRLVITPAATVTTELQGNE